jgi:outer membrane protein assembly factor BamB
MSISRLYRIALPLALLWACSGGGGGTTTPTGEQWQKFRRDTSNSGAAVGAIAVMSVTPATTTPRSASVDAPTPPPLPTPAPTLGAISSSPAIAEDGTVYIGSEGGTLAAFDADLTLRWRKTCCEACPAGSPEACAADRPSLGPLLSSPAIYTVPPSNPLTGQRSIFIGSSTGSVFGFQDNGTGEPTCTACFQPFAGTPSPDPAPVAKFQSSPCLTTDPVILTVNGVFIGAQIELPSGQSVGRLYALNSDGSLRWQYPPQNESPIGPVTSSPALGVNSGWYFTTSDGYLYALNSRGGLIWKTSIGLPPGPMPGPTPPFAPAVLVTGDYIVTPTGEGDIFAITPDTKHQFRVGAVDSDIGSSLAFGSRGLESPSPTPAIEETATPTLGSTPTATVTPIPVFVYAVTQSGQVVAFDPLRPIPTVFSPPATPIATPVLSSPALSSDGFLVFGDSAGWLHAVSTVDGTELAGFPIQLSDRAIRSSPAIASDGTIYVGADDGMLYAVGLP